MPTRKAPASTAKGKKAAAAKAGARTPKVGPAKPPSKARKPTTSGSALGASAQATTQAPLSGGPRHKGAPTAPSAPPPSSGPDPASPPPGPSTPAIVAAVCGGLSVLLWFIGLPLFGLDPVGAVLGLALPIAATVCGFVALNESPAGTSGRALALVGIILGLTQIGLLVAWFLFFLVLAAACGRSTSDNDCSCSSSQQGSNDASCCDGCGDGCGGCDCGGGGCDCGDGCGGGGGGCDCSGPSASSGSGSCCGLGLEGMGGPWPLLGLGTAVTASALRPGAASHVQRHAHRAATGLGRLRLARNALAHHPDTPAYAQDVYLVRGARLCIGCFTAYPAFAVAGTVLALAPGLLTGGAAIAWGLGLALMQAWSSLGLARTRAAKAFVKACLGVGLAVAVHGVLGLGWDARLEAVALGGLAALAFASAIPRRLRMRRAAQAP